MCRSMLLGTSARDEGDEEDGYGHIVVDLLPVKILWETLNFRITEIGLVEVREETEEHKHRDKADLCKDIW